MREHKPPEEIPNDGRGPAREEKLLQLLRTARAPEPSPEYLAAFWPRLREKLAPRRPAILQPVYYGGLAAAAAALVLWVSLSGPSVTGRSGVESPVYTLATASSPAEDGQTAVSYISGPSRRAGRSDRSEIDYILPRSVTREVERLEV
jgi:peptidoglycan/LPS O-acetylase OafA/YrhL